MKVRTANLDEVGTIWDLWRISYDYPQVVFPKYKARFKNIYQDHYIIEDGDEKVGCLYAIPLSQNLRGIFKPMVGIANVAVAPEFRMKGYAKQLMKETMEDARKNGVAVSTLYPFRSDFYRKMGYVPQSPMRVVIIDPKSLSLWKNLPEGYSLRRMRITEGFEDYKRLHNKTVEQFHGGVMRSDIRWEFVKHDDDAWLTLAYNAEGVAEGAMVYFNKGYGHGIFGDNNLGTIEKIRFHYSTLNGKCSLLHFLHLHSDQTANVELPVYPIDANWYSWVDGVNVVKIRHEVISMARIIDPMVALTGIPTEVQGYLSFKLIDSLIEENSGNYLVGCLKDSLEIKPTHAATDREVICITVEGLTALLYGSLSVEECIHFGYIQSGNSSDLKLLGRWFPTTPYLNTEFF